MTTMVAELYDALVAAGSPEEKARKAAETMAGFDVYEQRFVRIEADIAEVKTGLSELKRDVGELKRDTLLLKWMMGFLLAFQIAIFIKLFVH